MFVLKSKYDSLKDEFRRLESDYRSCQKDWFTVNSRVAELMSQIRVYSKNHPTPSQFTQEEINKLIRLCHPDKHGNSVTSTEITTKLLKLRKT